MPAHATVEDDRFAPANLGLMILIESMVRAGCSEREITRAVETASAAETGVPAPTRAVALRRLLGRMRASIGI